jgi:hypothetical protein
MQDGNQTQYSTQQREEDPTPKQDSQNLAKDLNECF